MSDAAPALPGPPPEPPASGTAPSAEVSGEVFGEVSEVSAELSGKLSELSQKLSARERGKLGGRPKGSKNRATILRENLQLQERLRALEQANPLAGEPPPAPAPLPPAPAPEAQEGKPPAGDAGASAPPGPEKPPEKPAAAPEKPPEDPHPDWKPLGERTARKVVKIAGYLWDRIAPRGAHLYVSARMDDPPPHIYAAAARIAVLDEDERLLLDEHVAPELAEVRAPPRLLAWGTVAGIIVAKAVNLAELVRTGRVIEIPRRAVTIVAEATREAGAALRGDRPPEPPDERRAA